MLRPKSNPTRPTIVDSGRLVNKKLRGTRTAATVSRGAHVIVGSAMEGAKEKEKEAVASATDGYDYLDSDDDEIDYSVKPEFYDPDLDDKDELWVLKKRKGCISDAILSCPACFTTLCLDCQRHEKYVTQFRAMFVVNCNIMKNQVLRERKSKPRKTNRTTDSMEVEKGAVFRPVCCSVCSTEVGVFDEDEVYHFFNVIPSEP